MRMSRWRLAAVTALAALPLSMIPVGTAGAITTLPYDVVAVGDFQNPMSIETGPDGYLYVVEGGAGAPNSEPGDDNCVEETWEDDDGEEVTFEACVEPTGRISRVDPDTGERETWLEGLPSIGDPEEEGGGNGAQGMSFTPDGSAAYVTVGLGGGPDMREEFGEDGEWLGQLLKVDVLPNGNAGNIEAVADIAQFEADENPDGRQDTDEEAGMDPDSNPFGVAATDDGGAYVADAGGNTVLWAEDDGNVELVVVLPEREVPAPEFLEMPPGETFPQQSVPVDVLLGEDGMLYVSEFTGFPHEPYSASFYVVDPEEGEIGSARDGLNLAMGMDWRGDDIIVTEFARDPMEDDFRSSLVRIRPDGGFQRIYAPDEEFLFSSGVAVGEDGIVYALNAVFFGPGASIVAFDLSQTGDEAIQDACDPDQVGWHELTDIGFVVHEEAINCLNWWGILEGFADDTFGPSQQLSRGQMAAVLDRLVSATDAADRLEDDPSSDFTDIGGTTHEESIERMYEAGIVEGFDSTTYRPGRSVTRAQLATMLVRTWEFVTGEDAEAEGSGFDDVRGGHAENVAFAAEQGWVVGYGDGNFRPALPVTRAQAALMGARMLSSVVAEGHAELPS
jgi:hypothetical protein